MSVLFVALPIALILGGGGVLACILCIRGGQYDDLDTPSVRMLIDEEMKRESD
ncbi:cbb3-type cytochrome oxidase assembly protein CcoS [Rhodopirellula sallentina]|uniref:Cytochrome oxidase maturation protein cbb3-type n=1 Tax=Rhodopirellula sallentina SM41 TaxID=1263870 RepID=M5U5P9_9BACT|nr:cbb3-type cytochrome oxidase assembly protein CcoS [Rhodopirellula sallentina]EMI56777.1 Cytochrome oxidase maturation protein cbb3-type [Rhodopirellula sallentina SM41]